jgi:diadenosine tetraphosphatase ApaH/serine/threonine PP2A family protein phosphatase
VPVAFHQGQEAHPFIPTPSHLNRPLPLGEQRAIINCGSIGQPRDGDPRACYMAIDTEAGSFEYRRLPYPIRLTQRRMRRANLPEMLITRLDYGW